MVHLAECLWIQFQEGNKRPGLKQFCLTQSFIVLSQKSFFVSVVSSDIKKQQEVPHLIVYLFTYLVTPCGIDKNKCSEYFNLPNPVILRPQGEVKGSVQAKKKHISFIFNDGEKENVYLFCSTACQCEAVVLAEEGVTIATEWASAHEKKVVEAF